MTLVLASASATRRAMLEAAGVRFTAVSPAVDEDAAKASFLAGGLDGRALADALAELKAMRAAAAAEPGAIVLGCDQTLVGPNGRVFSKPGSREEARDQLAALRGAAHKLHSAAVAVEGGRPVWRAIESVQLSMRGFSDAFLESYLDAEGEAVTWSVGAYRIEGRGAQLFTRVQGSHFAVLGLPLLPLLAWLRERGVLAA